MTFRSLDDRILVRRIEADEKTASGITIPDIAKEKLQEGEGFTAGPDARNETGQPNREVGGRRKSMLEDIAILTGGTAISEDLGVDGAGKRSRSRGVSPRSRRRSRRPPPTMIARSCRSGWPSSPAVSPSSASAASTEVEVKERKDWVDGAIHATRAAVEEGILPGGGVALLGATKALDAVAAANADQRYGPDIVRRAIEAPARQIAENSGANGPTVIGKLREALPMARTPRPANSAISSARG
ncbi:MAG: hypothetical protein EOS23_31175 [Mesorhizobium sp.]|nr:MAG: hypothetical protein EOS23_31175 [Mesorhizobium sp.]